MRRMALVGIWYPARVNPPQQANRRSAAKNCRPMWWCWCWMWCVHSSVSHPAKLEKLSHSNCHNEVFSHITCCHPLHCSPSQRALAPMPSAEQGIPQAPRGGCFPSCLSSHITPKVIQRFGEEHHLVTVKLPRLFKEIKQFKELQEILQDPLLDKWSEQQALLICECERT